jgi:hypothetical protein
MEISHFWRKRKSERKRREGGKWRLKREKRRGGRTNTFFKPR